jgi:metal-responsive CopG/Arc/MetJ family transcriptional regulator
MPEAGITKSIAFDPEILAYVDKLAGQEYRSRSKTVNYLIRRALQAEQAGQARELAAALEAAK